MFAGWRMLAYSVIMFLLGGGLYYTALSAYLLPLSKEFETSRAKISLIFSLRTLEGGIEGPFGGYLTDRFGGRFMMVGGVLMSGGGFIVLSLTHSFGVFLAVFLGLVTVGFSLQVHGGMVTVTQWFRRRLGTAISFITAGVSIGGFLLTPAIAYIIIEHGWRWASATSGILMLAIGIPLAFQFRRPSREESRVDDPPPRPTPPGAAAPAAARTPDDDDFTVREALRTRTYWLLAFIIGCRLMAKSALLAHFVPLLGEKEVSEGVAVTLLAISSIVRVPFVFFAGFMGDRWSLTKISSLAMFTGVLSVAILLWGPNGFAVGALFAIIFGISEAANGISWALVAIFFGRAHFGVLRGLVAMITSFFSAAGPLIAGRIFDVRGEYTLALWGALILLGLGGTLYWIMTPPVPVKRVGPAPGPA